MIETGEYGIRRRNVTWKIEKREHHRGETGGYTEYLDIRRVMHKLFKQYIMECSTLLNYIG